VQWDTATECRRGGYAEALTAAREHGRNDRAVRKAHGTGSDQRFLEKATSARMCDDLGSSDATWSHPIARWRRMEQEKAGIGHEHNRDVTWPTTNCNEDGSLLSGDVRGGAASDVRDFSEPDLLCRM